jgi:RNA polymerase sigma-70 factor (ECF subfamily)
MMSIGSLSLKRARTAGERPAGTRPVVAVGGRMAQNGYPTASPIPASKGSAQSGPASSSSDTLGTQKINMVRPPKEVTDDELLERFQHGDEDGYVELYLRRQAEVFTFALRLAGGDRDLASDLFQETFIKVYRKAHTFRAVVSKDGQSGTNVLGWLYTIVRTTYLNHKRRRTLVGLDDMAVELPSTDRSLSPEYREEQATLKERVEGAILSLAIEIREPFVLREFDGLSYQEISDQLQITLGAVRQRIYRAKLAMREQLWDLVHDEKERARDGNELLNDEGGRL